jgi:adenylate cyclase
VMQDGGDLYGDGVNVAARLESIADPGGIMVSETVFNLTNRHLAIGYDFAGEQKVKEQDEPIAAYRVRMPGRQDEADKAEAEAGKLAFTGAARVPVAPALPRPATRPSTRLGRWSSWFGRQTPRAVRGSIFMILMFAMINLLTNGFSEIWFVYPSIPFAFFLVVRGLSKRA